MFQKTEGENGLAALPAKPRETVRAMDAVERTEYFNNYAGYYEDSPLTPYAIRIGSQILFADGTQALRKMFDHYLRYGTVKKIHRERKLTWQ